MLPEQPRPLTDDSPGCSLEDRIRSIQNGSKVYSVSLNQQFLSQLGLCEQSARTKHSVALRPVEIQKPAYIIQPVGVLGE